MKKKKPKIVLIRVTTTFFLSNRMGRCAAGETWLQLCLAGGEARSNNTSHQYHKSSNNSGASVIVNEISIIVFLKVGKAAFPVSCPHMSAVCLSTKLLFRDCLLLMCGEELVFKDH